MNIQQLLKSTVFFIAEFKQQFEEMDGADEFLDNYYETLDRGISKIEGLDPHERKRLLETADEVLGIIAAEWDKTECVHGGHLRLAMVERLRSDIREAIKGLNKAPATRPTPDNGKASGGH